MEKIAVPNAGGGLPTELIGLAATGDYLLAKQPLAYVYEDFTADRERAETTMRGVYPVGGGLRQRVIVSHIESAPWIIGDLHERNIMRDSNGQPTIIDALIGKITPLSRKKLGWLDEACQNAKLFRQTGRRPRNPFGDVDDDEL